MNNISAIILAAGKSTRMGQQKMLMPWGESTILGQVIHTLHSAEIVDINLVTNSNLADVLTSYGLPILLNDNGEMLESIQRGLEAQKASAEAVLVCLGDQPQVEDRSVRSVCEAFQKSRASLVVPSYQMRRGHPWLAARKVWKDILDAKVGSSMREFLNAHADEIEYVTVDSPTVLQDLDTPEDYLKYKPSL